MTAKQLSDMDENTQAIRVLVGYSKTDFFYANGQAKGIEAELMHQ